MTTMTVRHVPEEVHRELTVRAARAGQSLQEYSLSLLVGHASHPSQHDVLQRIRDHATLMEPVDHDDLMADLRQDRT
jgi:hypothetical protein